jgi:hypothetical protein
MNLGSGFGGANWGKKRQNGDGKQLQTHIALQRLTLCSVILH